MLPFIFTLFGPSLFQFQHSLNGWDCRPVILWCGKPESKTAGARFIPKGIVPMGRLSRGQNSSSLAEPSVRFHACRRCAESRNVNDVVIYLHFVQTVLTDVRSRSSRPNRHRADNRSVTLTIKKHPPKGGCLFYGAESRNRTGTGAKSQQILSLLRLPVPPYPLHSGSFYP